MKEELDDHCEFCGALIPEGSVRIQHLYSHQYHIECYLKSNNIPIKDKQEFVLYYRRIRDPEYKNALDLFEKELLKLEFTML